MILSLLLGTWNVANVIYMLTQKVKTQHENLMELNYKIEEMLQASSIK